MSFANLATRFIGTPLMMHPPKLEVIVKALEPRLGFSVDSSSYKMTMDENTKRLMAHYSDEGSNRNYSVIDGIAIIPIQGTLTKRLTGMEMWSGGCSYMEIQDQLDGAMSDAGVRSVMLDIDSPGGEVSGCFELADYIYGLRGQKPIWAVANDCALSAAYAIASAADKIYVTRTGAVGSIGVYALHCQQADYDKKLGVKYTYVFAGKNKVAGNPHEPLSEAAESNIQTEVDREYDMFTSAVARNRGIDQKDVIATDANLMWAEKACPMLADEVGTFDDAMTALSSLPAKGSTSRTSKRAASAAIPIKGEAPVLTQAEEAAKKAEEDEMKGKGEKKPDEKKDDDTDDTEAKNKGRGNPPASAAAAVAFPTNVPAPAASRSDDEIMAISNLCAMAGVPARSAEYLTKRDAKGAYVSVASVSQELMAGRATEAERTGVMHNVDVSKPGTGKLSMDRLESEARAFAKTNRNIPTSCLYGNGVRKGTTEQQAIAAALEDNPEVYASYRERHNAGALIAQLQRAGVSLQFAAV